MSWAENWVLRLAEKSEIHEAAEKVEMRAASVVVQMAASKAEVRALPTEGQRVDSMEAPKEQRTVVEMVKMKAVKLVLRSED